MSSISCQPPSPPAPPQRRRPRVLIGATGSVATVKLPQIVAAIAKFAEVRVILTSPAKHFMDRAGTYNPDAYQAFKALGESVRVYTDEDEWSNWDRIGDPVIHIELRAWADLLLIAPLSANTLAKLANGMSDNLLTSVVRAWDMSKPTILAPAMNTHMWDHPFTSKHLQALLDMGCYSVIDPASKLLACGDTGKGALAEVGLIVDTVKTQLPPVLLPLAGGGGEDEATTVANTR